MSVMVWDVVRFELMAELTGHTGVVSCLQFNDRLLVTGSHDRTLRIWSMIDYECKHVIKHHSDAVTCLILEDDVVISGSFDR
nr:F-box/WD repeat-containing protein 11-like [Lytechinus pictus]